MREGGAEHAVVRGTWWGRLVSRGIMWELGAWRWGRMHVLQAVFSMFWTTVQQAVSLSTILGFA